MSVTADRADIEPKKLDQLLGALLQDFGGAFAVPLVRMIVRAAHRRAARCYNHL
jgi:hypothetical protein